VSDLKECDVVLHGLSDTVKVEGIGWVEWSIQNTFGQVTKIHTAVCARMVLLHTNT
jgi:hypothetical protein